MATSAELNVALNSNQRLEKSSSAYGNQPLQPQVGLGGLRGWHLPRQACSRHSAGSVSPPHTATPCECSDTTPPAPWHTPSATGQGLPQLPERENRINLSSCVLEWFPLQSEHGNTIQYSHLFINVFKHISIQQFLTCPKLWLESQRKKTRKATTVELPSWSAQVSAPQQSIPPSSTFGKMKKLKIPKYKTSLCLAHKNYQMTWNRKTAHYRNLPLSWFPKLQPPCSPVLLSLQLWTSL